MTPAALQPERGSATVLAATFALVVLATAAAATAWAGAVALRHEARVAADLAALAGAGAIQRGADGCAWSMQLAAANAAVLRRCTAAGETIEVVVSRSGHVRVLGRDVPVTAAATARAGPAPEPAPAAR